LGDESELLEGGTLSLLFRGMDKWKSTHPGRLLYSFRLDQHDWSPFQDLNAVSFPDLAAGKHYFQVRAMDRAGNIEPVAARLEFNVVIPWYRETRLVLIAAIGMVAALFFAGLAFNRSTGTGVCCAVTRKSSDRWPSARASSNSPTASCFKARR
jgi:hypothetical protein